MVRSRLPGQVRSLLRRGGSLLHRLAAEPPRSPPGAGRLRYSAWSWVALADGEGGEYHEVDSPHSIHRRPPGTCGAELHWKFLAEFHRTSPATFVTVVPGGRVAGPSGAVLTRDGHLLGDVSVELGRAPEEHSIFGFDLGEPLRRDGPVVVLSAAGGGSYFHWLFDVLPRLDVLRRSEVPLSGEEYFLVNSLRAPYQTETLERLGIPLARVIESEAVPHIAADRLLVPSLPGLSGNPSHRVCEFLRSAFISGQGEPHRSRSRRIYVTRSRAESRRIVNEAEVVAALESRGFETVTLETLAFAEQVDLFGAAECVVAPHGAGLSNLVFARPGTRVLEIFSPAYVNVCYWALSEQVGLDYHFLVGEGEPPPAFVDPHRANADITIAPGRLLRALDLLEH